MKAAQAGLASKIDNQVKFATFTLPRGRMRGDVNNDGYVSYVDYNLIATDTYWGKNKFTSEWTEDMQAADADTNGEITTLDRTYMSKFINHQKLGIFPDITENWTQNPGYISETNQFYFDIPVQGISQSFSAVLFTNSTFDGFDHGECIDNAIRIHVRRLPSEEISGMVMYGLGNGTATLMAQFTMQDALNVAGGTFHALNCATDVWDYRFEKYSATFQIPELLYRDTGGFLTCPYSEYESQYTLIQNLNISVNQAQGSISLSTDIEPTSSFYLMLYIPKCTQISDSFRIQNLLPKPVVMKEDMQRFVATYGTTSYADILNAYNSGRNIVLSHGTSKIELTGWDEFFNTFVFIMVGLSGIVTSFTIDSNNTWATDAAYFEVHS